MCCGVRIIRNSDIVGKVEEIKLPQSEEIYRSGSEDEVYLAEWLKVNFELVPEVCDRKVDIYSCYAEYCTTEGQMPLKKADERFW